MYEQKVNPKNQLVQRAVSDTVGKTNNKKGAVFIDNRMSVSRPIQTRGVHTHEIVSQLAALSRNKLNIVGETHSESAKRRTSERSVAKKYTGGGYWTENEFRAGKRLMEIFDSRERGDPPELLVMMNGAILHERLDVWAKYFTAPLDTPTNLSVVSTAFPPLYRFADDIPTHEERAGTRLKYKAERKDIVEASRALSGIMRAVAKGNSLAVKTQFLTELAKLRMALAGKTSDQYCEERSFGMHRAAHSSPDARGIWKVGDDHIPQIQGYGIKSDTEVMSKSDFETTYSAELKDD